LEGLREKRDQIAKKILEEEKARQKAENGVLDEIYLITLYIKLH